MEHHEKSVSKIIFRNDVLISASNDGMVCFRLWSKGQDILEFYAHDAWTNGVSDIKVSWDGTYLATVGTDKSLIVWKLPPHLWKALRHSESQVPNPYSASELETFDVTFFCLFFAFLFFRIVFCVVVTCVMRGMTALKCHP